VALHDLTPESSNIEALADAVASGRTVVWGAAEQSAETVEERRVVQQLGVLAALSAVHWASAPPSGDPPPITRWGRFESLTPIGHGANGTVYQCWDPLLERSVALKLLHSSAADDRTLAEARLLAKVRHHNIVTVYGVDRADGTLGIWMEHLTGRTLKDEVAVRGPLSVRDAGVVGADLCRGLAAVHAARLVHGDVKAQNVIREHDGRVVLMDFGAGVNHDASAIRVLPIAAGTPHYMADELFEGRSVSVRSDVYSVGVLLFYLITGEFPFKASTIDELVEARRTGHRRSLRDLRPDVPAGFARVVEQATASKPEDRFGSAGQLEAALQKALPPADGARAGRRRVVSWSAVAALASLVAFSIPPVRTMLSRFLVGGATPDDHIAAVLPFSTERADVEGQAYGRGLAAAVTDELRLASELESSRPQVLIVPAAEVLEADLKTADQAKRILSATALLTGRVDRSSSRTVITVTVEEASHIRRSAQEEANRLEIASGVPILASPLIPRLATSVGLMLSPRTLEILRARASGVPAAEEAYLVGRGLVTGQGANLDAAIDALQQAIRLDDGYTLAHAALSDAYLRKYRATLDAAFAERARSSGERAIAVGPSVAYAHVVRGRVYQASGENERAIRELHAALEIDDGIVDARRGLAEVYEAEGALQSAEDVYRQEIASYPHYWSPYVMFGSFLIKHGRYREAETSLVNGLKYAPDNSRAIGNLAGLYILTERLSAAETELRRGLALKPEVVVCNNLAWVQIYQGKFPEAVKFMEQAVQLPRADSFHWGNLARAYRWAGQHDQARTTYDKAIRIARQELSRNPRDARIRGNFAQMLAETGLAVEAAVEIAATLERAPTDMSVLFRSVLVSEFAGDREAAFRALGAAVRGGYSLVDIRRHPDLGRLREDPRFVDLMSLAPKPAAH
jgi:Tfp pilus assembly protein PilF